MGNKKPASPHYYEYVQNRLVFGIPEIKGLAHWENVRLSIDSFFVKNPNYIQPDTITYGVTKCVNCSWVKKLIFLEKNQ